MSLSRLVPRKGMDVLIQAAAAAGPAPPRPHGRHRRRRPRPRAARRLVESTGRAGPAARARVATTTCPRFYGCADVFAMLCRNRWAGLEQEGFGIVFLEAAAAGVPQVAGDSGGAAEAVVARRDGPRGRATRRRRRGGRGARRAARRPRARGRDGRRRPAAGRRRASPTTCSRRASATRSRGWEAAAVADGRRRRPPATRARRSVDRSSAPARSSPRASRRPSRPTRFGAGARRRSRSCCSSSAPARCSGPTPSASRAAAPSSIDIAGLFFLAGDVAPRADPPGASASRWPSQVVAVVVAASIRPYTEVAFGILAPMFGLGLMGLWGGRYGTFPPRRPARGQPS